MRLYKEETAYMQERNFSMSSNDVVKRRRKVSTAKRCNRHSWSDFTPYEVNNNANNRYSWTEDDDKLKTPPRRQTSLIQNEMLRRTWTGSEIKLPHSNNSVKLYDRRNAFSITNLAFSSPTDKKTPESKWSGIRRKISATVCSNCFYVSLTSRI